MPLYLFPLRVYVVGINVMKGCGSSLYLFSLSLLSLFFVVEIAFVAWTYDAQVFLAGALEEE